MSILDTKIVNEKLEDVFIKLDSAAKIKIALGFFLRNVEMGENRYCYAHENITLFENRIYLYKSGFAYNPGKSWRV